MNIIRSVWVNLNIVTPINRGYALEKIPVQVGLRVYGRYDTILFLFDGCVLDKGACFEFWYCYAKGKRCNGYKTTARWFIDGFDNVMLYGAPKIVLSN